MRTVLLAAILSVTAPVFVSPAEAGQSEEAERYRLQAELDRLARRNVWTGVERTYGELMALSVPIAIGDHLLGAQAAQSRGDMLAAMERFERAVGAGTEAEKADPESQYHEAKRTLEVFKSRYGKVDINVDRSRVAMMFRTDGMPFSAQERESIVYARNAVVKENTFRGLLPVGNYNIDGQKFEVASTEEWHVIKVEAAPK